MNKLLVHGVDREHAEELLRPPRWYANFPFVPIRLDSWWSGASFILTYYSRRLSQTGKTCADLL